MVGDLPLDRQEQVRYIQGLLGLRVAAVWSSPAGYVVRFEPKEPGHTRITFGKLRLLAAIRTLRWLQADRLGGISVGL